MKVIQNHILTIHFCEGEKIINNSKHVILQKHFQEKCTIIEDVASGVQVGDIQQVIV